MSDEKSDLERLVSMYRAALENIAELARDEDNSLQDILEIASDALAEDAQEG